MPTSGPVVIKLGGGLLHSPNTLEVFWKHLASLKETAPVLVVHGGGQQATDLAHRLDHKPRIIQGRRVTTDLDLQIIQWVLRGELNLRLVAQAARHGLVAVGLSGADGGLLRVHRRPPWTIEGETVDFGWVGDVDHVDVHVLEALMDSGFVPVIASLGMDNEGLVYNVNADTVAQALAVALQAGQLLLVTDAGGVRRHADDPTSRLPHCDGLTYQAGLQAGWIAGGMRVKLHVAFEALHAGVGEVHILAPDDLLERANATQVYL